VLGAISLGVKQLGPKAGYSSPFSTEVKNMWSCISTLSCIFMVWYLARHTSHMSENCRMKSVLCAACFGVELYA